MKLLFTTHRYGDRIMISPGYGGRAIFFAGEKQPRNQQLITVELPGLPKTVRRLSLPGWMKHTAVSSPSPHTLYELPADNWRPATLEDFLDAENYQNMGWWLHEHFLLDDFSRFADKWLPPVQEQIRQALALAAAEDPRRPAASSTPAGRTGFYRRGPYPGPHQARAGWVNQGH
jgi:hypothetical protein